PTRLPSFRISAVVKPRSRAPDSSEATRRTMVVFPEPRAPVRSRARASRRECRAIVKDRRIEAEKQRIREKVWSLLEKSGEALFPGARGGARVGKGGGFSDLEYAIGREFGAIDDSTRVATTVHSLQLRERDLPVTDHDFLLDLIATPKEVLRPRRGNRRQPQGVIPG